MADASGERNLYPLVRDLLVTPSFGVGLRSDQVVVDSALAGTRDIPDLTIFNTKDNRPLRSPDHAYAVFEVKRGRDVSLHSEELFAEKRKYVKAGTRWFFLLDQQEVHKWDIISGSGPEVFQWDALKSADLFLSCFQELRQEFVTLERQLELFREGKTRYAYQSIDEIGKRQFIDTIREVATILSNAVAQLVETKVVPALKDGQTAIAEMEEPWGAAVYDWTSTEFPIEFTNIVDEQIARTLPGAQISEYPEAHDTFAAKVEHSLYAIRIEREVLRDYSIRMGVEKEVSLLKPRRTNGKLSDSGKVVESFIYETASLIVSRMLMVRFSEDQGFLKRYISNGGVEVFARYAHYYAKPMQALLRETYRQSSELYRSLFDPSALDWVLDSSDVILSQALLHSMFLLSRWDFTSVHGDILSGVYDHYLDPGKRRALGEVFTRPEIARYMLERCSYDSTKTVLDPACGTGTFLVEALNQDVRRLRSQGMLNEQTVTRTLRRLHGLDISPFSVSLAQIQLLWHNLDLFRDKTKDEIRALATHLVPAIQVEGGHSSLDTLGAPLVHGLHTSGSQTGIDFSLEVSESRRKRVAKISRRYRRIIDGHYDIVIANPPYVRPHRISLSEGTLEAYEEVARGQVDLYVHFFYRAMRGWVNPAGMVAFIVPISILEASYAAGLRRVLSRFKYVEIVDMEALRKKTFRGIKRPTVILILQNSAGNATDDVRTTTLSMDCYDTLTDTIDFTKAHVSTIKRWQMSDSTYLPASDSSVWMADLQLDHAGAILTKLVAGDHEVLSFLSACPRLGSLVSLAYKRRASGEGSQAGAVLQIPEGANVADWEPYVLLAYGIKLGSSRALAPSGLPIYKGQNIFPSGVVGAPMGFWDPAVSQVDSLRLYAYRHLFVYSRLYAIRNVSQLPSACPVPADMVFQNTAQLVQLNEDFPLNLYLLSRVPQWYAAKLLRTSIIEDLFTTWVKRNLLLIPLPPDRSAPSLAALRAAGEALISKDKDLANAHRHVERLTSEAGARPLVELFAENDLLTVGADLSGAAFGGPVSEIYEVGENIESDDPLFRVRLPNKALRKFLIYHLKRRLDDEDELELSAQSLGNISIPTNLTQVVEAIDVVNASDYQAAFADALATLDEVVARMFGLSEAHLSYIVTAMTTDGFLRQLRPNYEHRGIRVQAYADHGDGGRYQ